MRVKLLYLSITLFFLSCAAIFGETPPHTEKSFKVIKGSKIKMRKEIIRRVALAKGHHEGILLERDTMLINNGEGENTWVLDLHSGHIIKKIKPVGTFSEGITSVSNGKYWHADWDTKKAYLIRIEDDKMIPELEISFEPSHPAGCAWVKGRLYVITWTRGLGTQYHLVKMDTSGNVLDKIIIKGINEPSQIAWDGKFFWISSWFERRVYRVTPDTYEIKGYFTSPVKKATGIAWDGECFWLTGTNVDLYKIKIAAD